MEKFPVATCLTILLSLLVSGPGLLQRSRSNGLPDDSLSAFLLRPAAVREGQVYRLVTYIFVYEDVISLVCSAVIIWYFAGSFEKMVGTVKHSFLTLAFAVSLALLYLVLRTMASGLLRMTDAEGFTPVAFAMLAASIARSRMRRTVLFGVTFHMTFVPWLLLCMAWIIPSSSFLANLCGLLIGNIYGYGYCFALDFSESTASCLDQKFPFRLLKRIPGVKYVPGSLVERRAFQYRKLNPVPGSYPTQNYHSPPPPLLAMHMQHPNVQIPAPGPPCFQSPTLHHTAGAMGELCIQNHSHSSAGLPSASHLVGANSWVPEKTGDLGPHQAPGFLTVGAAPKSEDVCQVHVD
ncbi:rhomboid domain-containing protein 2 [Pantherophis guttatus]|uniref:Rhomboid domain-containing protein 2 n=1 Tax=Pantherophis guttatus TaxID=94885 RepID=A0A6P9CAF8_PANGU|nr:rhomboid domain-containing protein 2 [Pantherophis guttatus]